MTSEREAWARAEVFVRLLRRVNAVLVEHDPMGIAVGPAQALEYDIEAAQITRLTIEEAHRSDDVRRIVERVFAFYFGPGSAERLDLAAEDVWNTYRDLLARRAVKEPSRRALDDAAIEHARGRLWLAGAFEPALDEQLRSGVWRAWTWADRDVPAERLARYGEGGHVFTGDSVQDQIGRIVRLRMKHPPGVWIVPDPMAKPDDPSAYVETSTDAATLSAAWANAASAAGAIGFVTVDRENPGATHFLVLEGYDGDGVIYLERDRSGGVGGESLGTDEDDPGGVQR